MRIGIYGGSFNPIHIGHTSLAQSLISQGVTDEVWLLVSPLNPLKQSANPDILDYDERLHIARLATEGMQGIRVSDFENSLPIPSYMANTLSELAKAYPNDEFSLIIGADNWQDFHRWHKWESILSEYREFNLKLPHGGDLLFEIFCKPFSINLTVNGYDAHAL